MERLVSMEMSFEDIEAQGVEKFIAAIGQELLTGTYQPTKNRRVEIPKDNGKTRKLGIPTIKGRVVQGAVKLILEPIFEADFYSSSFGYRPTHGTSGIGSSCPWVGTRAHPSHRHGS